MTILGGGGEGSLLPPSKRDVRTPDDVVRSHARNLKNLDRGFGGGRMVNARSISAEVTLEAEDANAEEGEPGDDTQYAWEWDDRYTVVGTGTQVVTLSHIPVDESLFVRWHPGGGRGLKMVNEDFTVTDNTVTIPDPGYFAADDEFSFQYQFDPVVVDAPDLTGLPETFIEFGASGWRYLQVALADTADYSSPSFDDSGWAVGAMEFGNGGGMTPWAINTSLWVRKEFPASVSVVITVPVEDNCSVYVNGTFVGSCPIMGLGASNISPPLVVNVADDLTQHVTNVLAIRANDEVGTNSGDNTEVDTQVVGIRV